MQSGGDGFDVYLLNRMIAKLAGNNFLFTDAIAWRLAAFAEAINPVTSSYAMWPRYWIGGCFPITTTVA